MSKKNNSGCFKWATIGCLGTIFIISLSAIFISWRLTPLFKIDEEKGKIYVFGSLLEFDSNSFIYQFQSNNQFHSSGEASLKGSFPLKDISEIYFKLGVASLEMSNHESSIFSYDCKIQGDDYEFQIDNFDFTKVSAQCVFRLPEEIKIKIIASELSADIYQMKNTFEINSTKGVIGFKPNSNVEYQFELSATDKIYPFKNSNSPDAYPVNILLGKGSIDLLP